MSDSVADIDFKMGQEYLKYCDYAYFMHINDPGLEWGRRYLQIISDNYKKIIGDIYDVK